MRYGKPYPLAHNVDLHPHNHRTTIFHLTLHYGAGLMFVDGGKLMNGIVERVRSLAKPIAACHEGTPTSECPILEALSEQALSERRKR